MIKNILIVFMILKTLIINAQEDCLNGNTYISMPDADTYANRIVLQFNEDKVAIKSDTSKFNTVHRYKIYNDALILNDTINWGKIKCYKDYFELIDKNNYAFQYTKLKPTLINCSEDELKEIIASSYWEYDFEGGKTKIHITKEISKEKYALSNELIKQGETYMIVLGSQWNFTISKISKDTIKLYGLAKSNNLPTIVNLRRKL